MFLEQVKREKDLHPKVIEAMSRLEREKFVPDAMKKNAYKNSALPIECEQTISQPSVVAMMTTALYCEQEQSFPKKILEIGTGSGYQAAVLAELGCETYSVERHQELFRIAEKRLAKYPNIHLKHANGWYGWRA